MRIFVPNDLSLAILVHRLRCCVSVSVCALAVGEGFTHTH